MWPRDADQTGSLLRAQEFIHWIDRYSRPLRKIGDDPRQPFAHAWWKLHPLVIKLQHNAISLVDRSCKSERVISVGLVREDEFVIGTLMGHLRLLSSQSDAC